MMFNNQLVKCAMWGALAMQQLAQLVRRVHPASMRRFKALSNVQRAQREPSVRLTPLVIAANANLEPIKMPFKRQSVRFAILDDLLMEFVRHNVHPAHQVISTMKPAK